MLIKISVDLPIVKLIFSEDEKAKRKAIPKNKTKRAPMASTAHNLRISPRLVLDLAS